MIDIQKNILLTTATMGPYEKAADGSMCQFIEHLIEFGRVAQR